MIQDEERAAAMQLRSVAVAAATLLSKGPAGDHVTARDLLTKPTPRLVVNELKELMPRLNALDVIDKVLVPVAIDSPAERAKGQQLRQAWLEVDTYWKEFQQQGGSFNTLRLRIGGFANACVKYSEPS
jgi:hypothetical protein